MVHPCLSFRHFLLDWQQQGQNISMLKDLFEQVDVNIIIDFSKDIQFYNQL